eukprot:150322-Chlamydomonas_euryale.AAC.7
MEHKAVAVAMLRVAVCGWVQVCAHANDGYLGIRMASHCHVEHRHGFSMASAWLLRGFIMEFTWFLHGFNMALAWLQHGFNMAFARL